MSKPLLWAFAVVFLAACGQQQSGEPVEAKPNVWWQGDLVELDGEPVASGIKLEIRSGDEVESVGSPGAFRYRLETGCQGAGFVDATGDVQAAEVLRPCDEADVHRMNRLTRLSYVAGQAMPPKRVALRWDDREAVLSSPLGNARFRNSVAR